MLFIYKLRISQSQHSRKQCQKNHGVGYSFPPLQSQLNSEAAFFAVKETEGLSVPSSSEEAVFTDRNDMEQFL